MSFPSVLIGNPVFAFHPPLGKGGSGGIYSFHSFFLVIPECLYRESTSASNTPSALSSRTTISSKRGIGRCNFNAQTFIQYRSQPTFFSIKACIGNPVFAFTPLRKRGGFSFWPLLHLSIIPSLLNRQVDAVEAVRKLPSEEAQYRRIHVHGPCALVGERRADCERDYHVVPHE